MRHDPSSLTGRRLAACLAIALTVSACSTAAATPGSAPTPSPTVVPTPWPSVIALPAQLPDNPTFEQVLPLFAYRGDRPLEFVVNATQTEDGITVEDISFSGAVADETIDGYLVLPSGKGPFATVLYQHGSAGSREDFKPEAIAVARNYGIAGLTMSRPTAGMPDDLSESAAEVREIRRALDLIEAQPQLDGSHIGYVGFSMGSILGVPLVAVDPRVKAAVFSCLVPTFGHPNFSNALFAPHAQAATYLQFGEFDGLYTQDEASSFAAQVKGGAKVSWYPVGHTAAGTEDRDAWLADKLGA